MRSRLVIVGLMVMGALDDEGLSADVMPHALQLLDRIGVLMAKPDWMKERESRLMIAFRKCITCDAGGDVCGQTNYIPGTGRLNMYRCRRHPTVRFYRDTLACEDYSPRG